MELFKNIFFNTDKIIENSKIKISYVGTLFQNNSESVFLHYGFGTNWDSLAETEMKRTELGFQCELEILESDTLNFCFRNSNDEWDNNEGNDYIFQIEKAKSEPEELSLAITEEKGMEMHKGLRKSYLWSKKIRLAIYKLFIYVPKIVSGNYKRKFSDQ